MMKISKIIQSIFGKKEFVLIDRLLEQIDAYPIGLIYGKMGLCVYFYYLSRWEKNDKIGQFAENLLDDIIRQLPKTVDMADVTVESGLAGLAIGLSHLVDEKFIEGDINDILGDVDSIIFKKLAFLKSDAIGKSVRKTDLLHLLYYLYVRYKCQVSFDSRYIFQELIIKTVEMLEDDLQLDYFSEPLSFSIKDYQLPFFLYMLGKIYEINVYKDRITRILSEYVNLILAVYPASQANRLFLLWGIISVKPCLLEYKEKIESHIRLLKNGIDVNYIVNTELGNQNVYLADGLSGVYMLLFYLQVKHPEYSIDYNPKLFFERIKGSNAWESLFDKDFYFRRYCRLFEGFPGAHLVLLHIKNSFL